MALKRIDRTYRGKPTHHYELDGERVDGVTTLIGQGVPKPALTYWSAREVAGYAVRNLDQIKDMLDTGGPGPTEAFLKGVPWQKRDDAAVRGTDVHHLAERLSHGLEVDVPEHLYGYVDGYARWLDASGAEPILTEFTVASRQYGYAGTADLILKCDGVKRIADIKTGKGVYPETALQLAAYRFAEFYLAGVDHDDTPAERPLPEVDEMGWVLHVTEHGTSAIPVHVGHRQFDAFLSAADVARWAKTSKDLVGPPVRFDTTGEAA